MLVYLRPADILRDMIALTDEQLVKIAAGALAGAAHGEKSALRLAPRNGYPQSIRVDQGSGFISTPLGFWVCQKDVVLDFCHP
jgi:hypothetical protein